MTGNPDKLDGWDQICAHLGADRKTVIARGYPRHHHKTPGSKPRVYAFRSELAEHERNGGQIPNNSQNLPISPISQPG